MSINKQTDRQTFFYWLPQNHISELKQQQKEEEEEEEENIQPFQ